ncbi:MAG: helix-hairpin-helix domain-containing protein [Deltaproteobacteria bacterium]|nr:helix-hairpin-helix domain-containing protein [Deltaproteobacteria bacterium]
MKLKSKRMAVLAMAVVLAAMGMEVEAAKGKAKGTLSGVVNINEAGVAQLTMLPGIGEARAKTIREYAQTHPFKSVEELVVIKGIGEKGLAKLKPFVSVSGPTTAKWEKATATVKPVQAALPQ